MGDGAVNQGQVYESFNMAGLWNLPVIYVIENNRYGMGTSVARASAAKTELFAAASAYGIPGEQVDGMDVYGGQSSREEGVKHCPMVSGPFILEMMTYRYRGHSMSDPAKVPDQGRSRPKCARNTTRSTHVKQLLIVDGETRQRRRSQSGIDKEVRAIVVNEAAEFAQSEPRAGSVGALDRCSVGGMSLSQRKPSAEIGIGNKIHVDAH